MEEYLRLRDTFANEGDGMGKCSELLNSWQNGQGMERKRSLGADAR